MQSLLWVSQWHRRGIQENGNTELKEKTLFPTSYWSNPRAAEIRKFFTDNFKWREWFNPTKPEHTTWCVLLPESLDCSQWILHHIEVQSGLEKPARNDIDTLNYSSLWEHKNIHDFKWFYGRQTQLRGMDTRNREQFRDLSWSMWKSSFRASRNALPQPSPNPIPGKMTLAPTLQLFLLLLLQKFTFDSPLLMGSARTYCSIPWKPWSIWLYMILVPPVQIKEMIINKSRAKEAKVKWRCVPAHHHTWTDWTMWYCILEQNWQGRQETGA